MTTTDTAPENFVCPHCQKEIEAAEVNRWKASQVGRVKSEKTAAAARENGKKGGRPRKPKPDASTEVQP